MRPLSTWPRPVVRTLAVLFAGAVTLYSAVWMHSARRVPAVYMGIDSIESGSSILVGAVEEGGPAARAGLETGDRVVAVDGRPLVTIEPFAKALFGGRPGERVRLTVERPGAAATRFVDVVLATRPAGDRSLSRRIVDELLGSYPVLFLVVSVAVLLLRPEDPNAWGLALVFASFIAAAPGFGYRVPAPFRGFSAAFKIAFDGCSAGLFLFFFSVFPGRSPLDRRFPWLKWLWLVPGALVSVPLALGALFAGGAAPIAAWARSLPIPVRGPLIVYFFGGFGLGLLSVVSNALTGASTVRRKSRMIVWGTLLGYGPAFVLFAAATYARKAPYEFSFWVWAPCVLCLFLLPLSFAYAVLRHNVLEMPALLRRSARYLLVQRGSAGLLVLIALAAILSFALSFGHILGPAGEPAAIGLGVGFGMVLVWTGTQVQRRLSERIDRAFFRTAYDARHVLEDLAQKARFATSRDSLAALLDHHVRTALLPRSLAVYVESPDERLAVLRGDVPPGWEVLHASNPALADLARSGHPREAPEPRVGADVWALLGAECLVPITGRDGRLIGLLALGPRLSDEPYSGEDRRLLTSVAGQAGIALESIRMAGQMAERLEAERRAIHEMELARQVQTRLLPQMLPALSTLECEGRCVQARTVGGDYYDFLELGSGRVGMVVADIAGKGFPAALLMANLQASLRSRSGQELRDLPGQLRSVNHLLFRCSEPSRFATLFIGIYDDSFRRMLYANCGHNPAVILRKDGRVERLTPTAAVLGIFEEWECSTDEVTLDAGDLLVIFSDGITEAFSDADEEFGEDRFLDLLRRHRHLPVGGLIDTVIATVREFSGTEQEDDQTLVVARGR